jgi:dipeptidyl aminopeptidase/acylaminoacyl peptidase
MPTYHAQNSSDPKGTKRGCAHNRAGYRSPAEVQLPYEDVMIKTKDGVNIHAWFIAQDDKQKSVAPTIIFFHGNAGSM